MPRCAAPDLINHSGVLPQSFDQISPDHRLHAWACALSGSWAILVISWILHPWEHVDVAIKNARLPSSPLVGSFLLPRLVVFEQLGPFNPYDSKFHHGRTVPAIIVESWRLQQSIVRVRLRQSFLPTFPSPSFSRLTTPMISQTTRLFCASSMTPPGPLPTRVFGDLLLKPARD